MAAKRDVAWYFPRRRSYGGRAALVSALAQARIAEESLLAIERVRAAAFDEGYTRGLDTGFLRVHLATLLDELEIISSAPKSTLYRLLFELIQQRSTFGAKDAPMVVGDILLAVERGAHFVLGAAEDTRDWLKQVHGIELPREGVKS
jgi:hypothetical protein